MHQIVFNEISAAEVSAIPTAEQLKLIADFQVDANSLKTLDEDGPFGVVERDGKMIFRFRSGDYRVYFTVEGAENEEAVIVQRVLHAKSIKDFLFRAKMGGNEDIALADSRSFWKLIEEGEHAKRK